MNICILFILFNGMSYVTPACYTTGVMLPPQDVVYLQHLPRELIHVVYESPPHYYNHYRQQRRYVRNWRGYRNHYQRQQRIRRHRNIRPNYRHRYQRRHQRRQPRLKRRTVRRVYDNRGNLRRRVVTRRYRN
jgi:hypothetical protein